MERQRQRKCVGEGTQIQETFVYKVEKQMPYFEYLPKYCLFTNKNENKFL